MRNGIVREQCQEAKRISQSLPAWGLWESWTVARAARSLCTHLPMPVPRCHHLRTGLLCSFPLSEEQRAQSPTGSQRGQAQGVHGKRPFPVQRSDQEANFNQESRLTLGLARASTEMALDGTLALLEGSSLR